MVTDNDDLFLIDSTFLLKATEASFLGAPLLVDSEGRDHTHSFGLVKDLLRLRRKLGIRRAAIIVGRESIAETTENVLSDFVELLRQVKGTVVRQDADRVVDICAQLGTSARWIVSRDRTLAQLATDDLGLLVPSDDSEPEAVTKKSLADLGIRPDQVPALLALSDGKDATLKKAQAIRLLELYGSLEAAIADASTAPSKDWKRKLGQNKERLVKKEAESRVRPNRRITQSHDLIGTFIEDSKESADALRRYGFWSLTRLLPLPEGASLVATESNRRESDYKAIRNDADLRSLEECLSKADICAIDTETSGKDPRCATLFGISLSVKEGQAYFVPMVNTDLDGISTEEVRSRLNKVLSRKLKLVGHNLKYDVAVLQRNGFDPQMLYFDTMLAAYDCFGDWEFWNLAAVAKKLLGVSVRRYRDIVGDGETFLDRPFKELVDHACSDADVALRLHGVLSRELRKRQIEQRFVDVTMEVERFLIACERDGVRIDTGRMEKVKDAAKISIDTLRARAIACAGVEFDIDSPKATADTLRKLGIWEQTTRPVGDTQLEQLAGEYALAAVLVKYRRERKRYREIDALCAVAKDGCIYASYSQIKTPQGRLMSSSPSLHEAVVAGAVQDKPLVTLFGNGEAALEILREASGDLVLGDDLKQRSCSGDFLPGNLVAEGVNHREILLFAAIGHPEPAICRSFLIRREQAVAIRSGIVSRYQRLFVWLDEFKRLSLVQGFAEHGGERKYLAGLRSSDIDKRNKAVRSAVRWLLRY